MITNETWKFHKSFSANVEAELATGKTLPLEVSEEVFEDMLGVVPPFTIKDIATFYHALSLIGIVPATVSQLFLVGEPFTHNKHGDPMCDTFFARDNRYWYAGLYASKENC